MKKIVLCTLVCLLSLSVFAQQNDNDQPNPSQNFNELRLNGLYMVLGALEVSYERTLNEESGIGLNVFLPIDDEVRDDIQYYISPYYRFYFGKKYAAGFFLEGFGMLNSVEKNFFVNDDEFVTDFALGIGLGGKWVTKGGFVGELNLGFGRNLFNSNATDIDVIAKFGISLGYRF